MEVVSVVKYFESSKEKIASFLSNRSNVDDIAKITAISIATYYVLNKIYVGFYGPLANIPGPFISRFMDIPSRKYTFLGGTRYKLLEVLHKEYGHIVRLNPTVVSITDKEMQKQILVTDDLAKAPMYDGITMKVHENMFSTRNVKLHKQRRKIISPAFSIKYLNSLEPFMISVAQTLTDKIDKEIENTKDDKDDGIVDIWVLFQCFALDVIGETAFGQSFKMVENNSHFIPSIIEEELKLAAITSMFPTLAKWFLKNSTRLNPRLENFLKEIIYDRMSEQEGKRKDILQYLIDSKKSVHSEDRLDTDAIVSETVLFLIAGSETTSNTLGFIIYELLRHPDKLQKLYNEIDQLQLEDGQKLFNHNQLKHLPYLNAVINETLRLDAVASGGLVRYTTEHTVLGGQYDLPKDILIISYSYGTQMNPDYWEDPGKFIPERWIPEQSNIKPADNDAFLPFSLGSRNCIGKNFALQEMRTAISTLLKYYEITPIEKEMKAAEDRRHFITLGLLENSFKIRIKHRSL